MRVLLTYSLIQENRIYCIFLFIISLFISHSQLYEALHVGEHQIRKERELYEKLEDLNVKLGPLEKVV